MAQRLARRRNVLGGLLLLVLPGCGFHPLYARDGDAPGPAEAGLALVDVAIIPDRVGQLLRQDLQARLDHAGAPAVKRYELAVALGIASEGLGIAPDNTTTWIRLTARASWTLRTRDATAATVTAGVARAEGGLNTFDQQYFAQDIETQTVEQQLLEEVAAQITEQLAIWFRRHPA
jgi:LPS-assembly lipoprotein